MIEFGRQARGWLLGTGLVLATATLATAGDIRVCNESVQPMSYAIVENNWSLVKNRDWTISGWYTIDPKSCVYVVKERRRTPKEVYLSLREVTSRGTFLINTSKDRSGSGFEGVEFPLCVSSDAFKRTQANFDDLERCPDGWYLQMFNVYVFASPSDNFTLNVGGQR